MTFDDVPTWLLFVVTTLLVAGAIEFGSLVAIAPVAGQRMKESPSPRLPERSWRCWPSSWHSRSASLPIGMTPARRWSGAGADDSHCL